MASIDAEFIRPFLVGTCHTLKVQCNFDAVAGKPFPKGHGKECRCDIAGVIGVTSNAFQGSVSICFPEATFLQLMSSMLGQTFTTITSDLEDGAGELMNVIFGHAKRDLNTKGYGLQMAIPSVIRGGNLSLKEVTNAPIIIVPFSSGDVQFQIQIALKNIKES